MEFPGIFDVIVVAGIQFRTLNAPDVVVLNRVPVERFIASQKRPPTERVLASTPLTCRSASS